MSEILKVDAAIIGGGLAGGLAAVALSKIGLSCALVDAEAPALMRKMQFDGRTTAISYANARVFRRLGLWGEIAGQAAPINDILVTDGHARGRFSDGYAAPLHLHFDSRTLEPKTPLGWIVENCALRNALFDAIEPADAIQHIAPARCASIDRTAKGAKISLEDGRIIEAALVIAADGKNSTIRKKAGIRANRWSYNQSGIVATVAHDAPHKGVAQELFLPSGPFAILPLTENRSSLVWTERTAAVPAFLALSESAFVDEIKNRFGPYLGEVRLAGPRFAYPLSFYLCDDFIAPRLALIGDAAHAIHPIAGQGYNLGVKDIAVLSDVLEDAISVGLDIGALDVLENYQRWRRFDSASLAFGTDVLNRLFSNDITPLRVARRLGLGVVNKLEPLRQLFMRQAGADLGRLPSLMQP